MSANAQRPSVPALALLMISAFAIMATSPETHPVTASAETTIELTQEQPAVEITFTSQLDVYPEAHYLIEWTESTKIDVTTDLEEWATTFQDASVRISDEEGMKSATITVSALDPSSLTEPLEVTFVVNSEHRVPGDDPGDVIAVIEIDVDEDIERPVPPLYRIRPEIGVRSPPVAHWTFFVSTDAAVVSDAHIIVSRRGGSLAEDRDVQLWDPSTKPSPLAPGPADIQTPDDCFDGPCEFEVNLAFHGDIWSRFEFEIADGQGLEPSPFSVRAQENALQKSVAETAWGPVLVKVDEPTRLAFDVELPSLEDDAAAPNLYFVEWQIEESVDADSGSVSFQTDKDLRPASGWSFSGLKRITGSLERWDLEGEVEASGTMTVTVFTVDSLAEGSDLSVAVSP